MPFDNLSGSDLLTCKEAAHLLRLSVPTLERLRAQSVGPKYIKLGTGKRARVVYRRSDLNDWLDGNRRG
jgi:predicted DNA-binding transcriptional regulator AlpA